MKIHHVYVSTLSIYVTILKFKSHIETHTLIVGDVNTPFSPMYMKLGEKLNRNDEIDSCYEPNRPNRYLQNI